MLSEISNLKKSLENLFKSENEKYEVRFTIKYPTKQGDVESGLMKVVVESENKIFAQQDAKQFILEKVIKNCKINIESTEKI